MPPINQFKCSACTFRLPSGWGGIAYVTNYEGKRIILSHPEEDHIREEVLNLPEGTFRNNWYTPPKWWWSRKKKDAYKENKAIRDAALARCGFLSDCVCLDCIEMQRLDLARDRRECQFCSSQEVKSVKELLGCICPRCKKGSIVEIETGIWA